MSTNASTGLTSRSGRTVPLQVLSLGMSRTGTASMRIALETLGYVPTMHCYDILDDPRLADPWIPLIKAKWEGTGPITRQMLDAALGGYAAATDVPSVVP